MVRAHFFFNFWGPIEHRIKTISPPVLPMLVRASSTWVAPTCTRASKHHALLLLPNLPSRSAPHHYQGELDCPLASNWAVCSSQAIHCRASSTCCASLHAGIKALCAPSSPKLALPIRPTASLGLAHFCRHPSHDVHELVRGPCHEKALRMAYI